MVATGIWGGDAFDDPTPAAGRLAYGDLSTASADLMVSRIADDLEATVRSMRFGGVLWWIVCTSARTRTRLRRRGARHLSQ